LLDFRIPNYMHDVREDHSLLRKTRWDKDSASQDVIEVPDEERDALFAPRASLKAENRADKIRYKARELACSSAIFSASRIAAKSSFSVTGLMPAGLRKVFGEEASLVSIS
jgi:hypothetical protein